MIMNGRILILLSALGTLGGCTKKEAAISLPNDDYETATRREKKAMDNGKLFGNNALVFGGVSDMRSSPHQSIGVNSCLWRATLEVLSFLPLASADPFGGTISTDWYRKETTPDERLKVDVRILDSRLKADALKISVFRQKLVKGQWIDLPTDAKTAHELEDAVLTKARELHLRVGS